MRTQVQDSSTKANICRTNNQTKLKYGTMGFMNETIIDSILKCCSWQRPYYSCNLKGTNPSQHLIYAFLSLS
jgi:hypothetical protein